MPAKIAIVHDYLFQYGGAEKCVETWLEAYPEATLYTSFFVSDKFQSAPLILKAWEEGRIKTSWLQTLFGFKPLQKYFKHLVIFYPIVFSLWGIKGYDTVILSSTFCAKNIRFIDNPKILFYCYTPTRFLHRDEREMDLKTINPALRLLLPLLYPPLRWMENKAIKNLNKRKTHWIAISSFIQDEIKRIYKVDSQVIVPPVDLERFKNVKRVEPSEDFYLNIGRISFHKQVDLLVKTCLKLKKKLYIAGATAYQPEMDRLQEIIDKEIKKDPAKKDLIKFLGRISDDEMDDYLSRAKAFLFPPKEDFGIVPVEAIAIGCPVIAYSVGGSREYIKPGVNGVFFDHHTVESLSEAILEFESKTDWDTKAIIESSKRFSKPNFINSFSELINS